LNLKEELMNHFKEEKMIFANVLINAKVTPLTIEYESDKIAISNLGEDLPPFLRIWREKEKVEASLDRIKWFELPEEESRELQIYLLLDPVFLLPHVEIKRAVEFRPKVFLIDGSYYVEKLKLPDTIVRYFKEEENLLRWIRFYSINGHLISMSQQDFPPYPDVVTLIFEPYCLLSQFTARL